MACREEMQVWCGNLLLDVGDQLGKTLLLSEVMVESTEGKFSNTNP